MMIQVKAGFMEMKRNMERKTKGRQSRRVYFVRGFSCFCSVKKEIQPWTFVSSVIDGPIEK
jgi:hypothetical protein